MRRSAGPADRGGAHPRNRRARDGSPGRCRDDRCIGPPDHPRPCQLAHPCARRPWQGRGRRPAAARAFPHRQRRAQRLAHARGQVPERATERSRDGEEGLYRGVRFVRRVPGAFHRGYRRRGTRVPGCRHARGHRADDFRPHALPGLPGPGRSPARSLARRRSPRRHCALRREPACLPRDPGALAIRPRLHPAGARADHPDALLGRFPHRLPRPRARVRRRPPDPPCRIGDAGGHCEKTLRQEHHCAPRRLGPARRALFRRACNLDRPRRHAPHRRRRRGDRP